MKIKEVVLEFIQQVNEGGDSTSKRFFSELGALAAWAGNGSNPSFDPNHPEQWLDADKLVDPERIFGDIKRFLPDAEKRDKESKTPNLHGIRGYYNISLKSRDLILADMSSKGITPPQKFDWVGGENVRSVGATPSDVEFVDNDIAGVSIKDDGGVGVANLGAGELEIEGGGDLFTLLAPKEIFALKQAVMKDLIEVVKTTGRYEAVGKPHYNMTWNEENGKIYIEAKGKKTIAGTPEQLLAWGFLQKSNLYQRSLGDYFIRNGKNYKELSTAVLKKTSAGIRDAIEKRVLPNATKLAKLGGFGSRPYYYQLAKPYKVAFVPDFNTANDIEVVSLTDPKSFSGGLKYMMSLRRRGVDGVATVEVHIRYAQGVFGSSPTFRVQSLKGHENLYWEILNSK